MPQIELSQDQMGRMKELNQAGFKRVGKSSLFENVDAVIDVREKGGIGIMVDYDTHTDWSKIKGIQVGGGSFDGFSIVTVKDDGVVIERTVNGSGGGFHGDNKPTLSKFEGKSGEQQLLNAGFKKDKLDEEVYRYQVEEEHFKGEIVAQVENGQVIRMLKPIRDRVGELVGPNAKIVSCSQEEGRWDDTNTVITVQNPTMEMKVSTQYDGRLVEGSQRLLRSVSKEDLGIEPFEIQTESSGFKIGGVNETDLIRKLDSIAGQSIASLEASMRPMKASMAGFLGANESLLEVMAEDNDFVSSKDVTHQDLAEVLFYAREHVYRGYGNEFTMNGAKFSVDMTNWRGMQFSPFEDNTGTASDMKITNLETGAALACSCLLPDMIQRYGFYEGKGTSYRFEPQAVLDVFDFLVE